MAADNGDDLVLFKDVRVIHSTSSALLRRIMLHLVHRDGDTIDAK